MINRDKVYAYFTKFHGPIQQSTNGWDQCLCPICGQQKFAINFTYLTGKCWRGCYNGFLVDVIQIYHGINYFEALELIESQDEGVLRIPAAINRAGKRSQIQLPRGYHSILEGSGSLAVRARDYLEGRGFDLNYMDRLGIGYVNVEDPNPVNNYLGYIIIPFKKEGTLIYFIGRDYIGNYQRYKNPAKEIYNKGKSEVLFNEEALWIEPKIYLTEGWSCAATVQRRGVSQQGATPSVIQRNFIIKAPVGEVVIVPDAGFYLQGLTTARHLLPYKKVKVINLDSYLDRGIGKDVNEVGIENLYSEEARTPYVDQKFLYSQLRVYA